MDLTGRIIDNKYKIIKLIGSGGMAKVYKALDIRLDRYVAIKVLKEDYSDNEQFVKKFMKEAQADAKLAHPNIVNVYDVGSSKDINYIVMEYMSGPSLNDYLDEKGVLSAQETVDLIYSIALGINHAHANKIIHRDIKPHNILMTPAHMPKVADFGIAVAVSSSTLTATEDGLGSVHYVSPEQAKGGFLDERSDLYSLGIMMYEMLTGELPYDGDSPVAVALMHVQNTVESPKLVNKKIPDGVAQVVLNLTRKKPEERYQSARALLEALRKLKSDINAQIAPTYKTNEPQSTKQPKAKPKQTKTVKPTAINHKRTTIIAICVVAVVLFATLLVALMPSKMVIVPNFVGATQDGAQTLADENSLKIEITKYVNSPTVPEGKIAEQSLEVGSEVKARTVVELYVSLGPKIVEIPNVVDYYEQEAVDELTNDNFIVKEIKYEFSDEYEKGIVIQQNPSGGTKAAEGTEITLYVSKGKDVVSVPKLLEKTVDECRYLLSEAGLILGNVEYDTSNSIARNLVMYQTPVAFTSVARNTVVDIVVSLGKLVDKQLPINLAKYTSGISADTVDVRVEFGDSSDSLKTVYTNENADKKAELSIKVSGIEGTTYYYRLYINGVQANSGEVKF